MRFDLSRIASASLGACALVLLASAADVTLAQTSRQVRPVPQPAAPAAPAARTSPVLPAMGAPSASGLASPFPPSVGAPGVAGTSALGTSPPDPDVVVLDGAGEPVVVDSTTAVDTGVMGAGPYGAGAYGTRGMTRPTSGAYTAVDVARSFLLADIDRDGDLSRAEATRLSVMPLSFEEMDANHDDTLTRSEYEDALL